MNRKTIATFTLLTFVFLISGCAYTKQMKEEQSRRTNLKNDYDTIVEENKNAQLEKEKLEKELAQLNDEIGMLDNAIKENNAEIKRIKSKIKKNNEDINMLKELQNKNLTNEKTIEELKNECQRKREKIRAIIILSMIQKTHSLSCGLFARHDTGAGALRGKLSVGQEEAPIARRAPDKTLA